MWSLSNSLSSDLIMCRSASLSRWMIHRKSTHNCFSYPANKTCTKAFKTVPLPEVMEEISMKMKQQLKCFSSAGQRSTPTGKVRTRSVMDLLCTLPVGVLLFVCDHIYFHPVVCSSSSFLSSPNLSCRRLDVCHTCAHGVALVRI